jgi:hypothetical protein
VYPEARDLAETPADLEGPALRAALEHVMGMPQAENALVGGIDPGAWVSLGPNNLGGRIRGLVIRPDNPHIMLAAADTGGIWRTTNGGQLWAPVNDQLASLGIGSILMSPVNPDLVFAGSVPASSRASMAG